MSRLDDWIIKTEGLRALTREGLEALQLEKLNALLAREKARGGYYKALPQSLKSLDDLALLPFTSARDLAENASGMMLVSQAQVDRVISDATSGTQGMAKRVFYTQGDLAHTVGFFEAGLGELVHRGDGVLIAMPFSGAGGLGELISAAIERLGARPIKAGVGKSYGELRSIIEGEKPTCYVGMPVPLLTLLRFFGAGSLKRALVSADASPPSVERETQRLLGSLLFPHYGSREMGLGGAVTCPAHDGMHLRENHVIAEIVDGEGRRLPDGEFGELIITTVGMEALPLIRYRTGDRARFLPTPCPCGGATRRLCDVSRIPERTAENNPQTPCDITALDDALFALPNLADYAPLLQSKSPPSISIQALTIDGKGAPAIEQAARPLLPRYTVKATTRQITPNDTPLFPAKRRWL